MNKESIKDVKYQFYCPDDPRILYDEITVPFKGFDKIMWFGDWHSDTLMEVFGVDEVAWKYDFIYNENT